MSEYLEAVRLDRLLTAMKAGATDEVKRAAKMGKRKVFSAIIVVSWA